MHPAYAAQSPEELAADARQVLAGGVSASMRIHPYLGRPLYFVRGEGAVLTDSAGRQFLDFNMSNGATMLGHGNEATTRAVAKGLALGTLAAAETEHHIQLARTLTEIIPSAERVRFASTGSEVTLVAVRLARHVTGRTKLLKFDGHFHGLTEPFLFKSGEIGESVPSSGGVPESWGGEVVMVPFNDVERFDAAIAQHRGELAAVIVEPVHYNAGCIEPQPGFLEHLRAVTQAEGIVLIFDEVLSGFRMHLGGAQAYYGVTPDLSTWAKALANGMPLSALTGRADIMEQLAPGGPVAHSGTYSGHLLSVLAALATLDQLRRPGLYDELLETSETFYRDMQRIFDRYSLPVVVQGLGARFGLYFGRTEPVHTWADALSHAHELNRAFVVACLERGLYFHAFTRQGAPGHCGFSLAHTPEQFAQALTIVEDAAREIAR
jgi:glutamate-1-semialdehyde 2,1-aminomutase